MTTVVVATVDIDTDGNTVAMAGTTAETARLADSAAVLQHAHRALTPTPIA